MTTTAPVGRRSLTKIKDSVEYRQHQLDGIRQWARVNSFILADDMGLGKTLEALTIAAIDFQLGHAKRLLIVAPPTLLGNWAEELVKFSYFTFTILNGTPKQRGKQLDEFELDGDDILMCSYDSVVSHVDSLNALRFDIVIYDEAHYIKGFKSARTKACHKLRAGRHLLLTGSPLLNQVNELWSLFHRIDPITYSNYYTFCHRFCVYGGYKDKQIVGVKNKPELEAKLKSVLLRRRKKDLGLSGKLPPVDVYVDAHPDQVALIKQAKDEMRLVRADGSVIELANGMVAFMRKLQVLSTPANLGFPDNSLKLDRGVELIQEIVENGRPVVVFTQFRPTLECMTKRLNAVGIDWRQLHGDVAQKERIPIVRAWSEDASRGRPQALLTMLQVGGTGLNLVAADTAIFLDELFVPKLNDQAEDRLDRLGQTQPVTIIRLRVRKSQEQRKARILETKKTLFEDVVEEDDFRKKLLAALEAEDDDG